MKYKSITNVKVSGGFGESAYAVSCEADGARYHVWVKEDRVTIVDDKLYKNCPVDIKIGEPGFFQTRQLQASAMANVELVEYMLKLANHVEGGLFNLYHEKKNQEEAEDQARVKEERRVATIELAAMDLYEAVKLAIRDIRTLPTASVELMKDTVDALESSFAKANGQPVTKGERLG